MTRVGALRFEMNERYCIPEGCAKIAQNKSALVERSPGLSPERSIRPGTVPTHCALPIFETNEPKNGS